MSAWRIGKQVAGLFLVSTTFACLCASAAEAPVTIASTVPYLMPPSREDALARDCWWNTDLATAIVKQSNGAVVATEQDLNTIHGRTLRLLITATHVTTRPGNWATVKGELDDDGRRIGGFSFTRVTIMTGDPDCLAISRVGKALAADISNWLKHPILDLPTSSPPSPR